MTGSQTLGVRIPEHVLAGVDKFAHANEIKRSEAIAVLVERALSGDGIAPSAVPTAAMKGGSGGQNTASGQRAQAWGGRTARRIAEVLGAEKVTDLPQANEFILDGKRVAIKCAKPTTTLCGITNRMRGRVDYIICASQTVDGTFHLYKVTPEQWRRHASKPPEHNRNFRYLTHLSRSTYRRIGEDLGEIELNN